MMGITGMVVGTTTMNLLQLLLDPAVQALVEMQVVVTTTITTMMMELVEVEATQSLKF